MRTLLFFSLLLFGAVSAALAAAQTIVGLQQDNALLQAEFTLAKEGKPYLLIDLPGNQLQLKASGLALQTWTIGRYRSWGHPSALPANLAGKSSRVDRAREVQVVNAAEPDEAVAGKPFKALELSDMPTAYQLRLENGTVISVRPTPDRWYRRLYGKLTVPAWYLGRPLISSWNFVCGRPYNELALSLPEQDARKLYWAFIEGTPCLVRLQATGAAAAATPAETKR